MNKPIDRAAAEAVSEVRERVTEKMRTDDDFWPSDDDPSFTYLLVDLLSDVLGLVWAITALVSVVMKLLGADVSPIAWGVAGGGLILSFVCKFAVRRKRKASRIGEVQLARVVQCYVPGWGPPDEDPSDNPYFTGIVAFSFDPSVSRAGLQAVSDLCGDVKHAEDPGEYGALSEMLRRGDTKFVRESLPIPESISGVPRTFVADAMFDRERLPEEHLVTP